MNARPGNRRVNTGWVRFVSGCGSVGRALRPGSHSDRADTAHLNDCHPERGRATPESAAADKEESKAESRDLGVAFFSPSPSAASFPQGLFPAPNTPQIVRQKSRRDDAA